MQALMIVISITCLMSCGGKARLTEKDYKWMPYKGNETLAFQSNEGLLDTLFLLKKDTLLAYPDPLSLTGGTYEVLSIYGKYPDTTRGGHRYFENNIFQINKGKDKRADLEILFKTEGAWFYRESKIGLDSLAKVKPKVLKTPYRDYDDVYVFNGEDILGYSMRSNFITNLYWSKSQGLIRYDKNDSVYWELVKKW